MDRISSLPDDILCHILSFLPTKHAAFSSVISKRWLNMWKLVPNLDIDHSVFLQPEEGKGERESIRQSFVEFVDSLLAMQGDSPIKNFSLKCITGVHPNIVNRWICNVLQRGVHDLNLFTDFSYEDIEEDCYYLPEEMFLSRTLVKLSLRSESRVNWWYRDSGTFLPMLKSLYIDSDLIFCYKNDEFVPSFPVLEELRMANMAWMELDVTVSSASLRRLSLHDTGCDDLNPKSFSFDTPNLLFLNYYELVAEDYPLVNMKKLFEARINFTVTDDEIKRVRSTNNDWLEDDEHGEGEGDVVLHFGNVVKLMNGIQHVQRLSLPADTLEVLFQCCESMSVFNNLKMLRITSDEGRGWQAMPTLLRNCPHWETLIIESLLHYVTDKCGDACVCISREEKGRSLTSCPVTMLEIHGFRATIKELDMIEHFLDYFPCLKKMDIYIEEHEPTKLRNPQLSCLIVEMFKLYNKFSSCNVQFLVTDYLDKKWTAQGH